MNSIVYVGFALFALPLFLLPGWMWLRRAGVDPVVAAYAGFGATVAAAAAVVAIGLLLPWSVAATCSGGALLFVVSAVWCAWTAPRPLLPPRRDLAGIAVFVVATAGVAAFSAVPSAPQAGYPPNGVGGGLVHSARWPVMSIDNVLPYRTGQVALHKLGGEQVRDGYSPGWWIVDRGPLTGLAFAFAVGAAQVDVPPQDIQADRPRMTVVDDYGFWAYGIVAIMLNMALVLGVYLLGHVWLGRRVALVAALVVALAPGVFLNTLYTWPKQAVAYFVLAAAACVLRRRPLLGGVLATLGYLCHPGGLYWIPAVAVLLWCAARADGGRRPWRALGRYAAGAVAAAIPWQVYCSAIVHGSSRWTFSPLGYAIEDRSDAAGELGRAWDGFVDRGPLDALWVRTQSLFDSLAPVDLARSVPAPPPGGSRGHEVALLWIEAHGYSFWGMLGIALTPVALVVASRRWPESRPLLLWLALPGLVIAWLAAGLVPPFISQNAFAVVGLLALLAAVALTTLSRAWRIALVAAIGAELLTVAWPVLYAPFNVGDASRIAFTAVALGAQLALLAALAAAVGLLTGRARRR